MGSELGVLPAGPAGETTRREGRSSPHTLLRASCSPPPAPAEEATCRLLRARFAARGPDAS
eukprot:2848830-Heterocapsa_arctica.AAC.1